MAADPSEFQPEAWLYTREDESVRVEVHEEEGVWAASIEGPGLENRLRVFHEQATFDTFRSEHDRELQSKGFRLRVLSERRAGHEPSPAPEPQKPKGTVVRHERRRR
jgi:hypothetical protein